MTQVWQHSRHKGGSLLLLLAIADFADDEGTAWPSITTLAAKARMSERNIQYALKELEQSGELTIQAGGGRSNTNLYKVQNFHGNNFGENYSVKKDAERVQKSTERVQNPAKRVKPIAPEPSVLTVSEPSVEPSEDEPSLWPEWFSLLYGVWVRVSFESAEAWRAKTEITESLAEEKAYALRDWWPRRKSSRTKGNPYFTWQNWCRQDRLKVSSNGRSGADLPEMDEYEASALRLQQLERDRNARRGIHPVD